MRAELWGGPLDGRDLEVSSPAPYLLHVPYLPEAYEGALSVAWEEINPNPLHVPCPVSLVYIRDTGLHSDRPVLRYRYRAG